jgi:hypothetical protein
MPTSLRDAVASDIIDAVSSVRSNPELLAEAMSNPEGVADRLGLRGAARQAVMTALVDMPMARPNVADVVLWWDPGIAAPR